MQKLLKWAYIGTSVVIISLGIGYLMTQNKPSKENSTVAQTTLADTLANTNNLSDTESIYNILNGNSFVINSSRDTIVKTKDGKLIEIPKELFMDTMFVSNEDSTLAGKIVSGEVTQAKIYTLHFYSPNFPDTLKKWKQAIKDKNYSKAVRSFISSSNPKNYIKTSSKKQDIQKTDSIQTSKERDTIYQVVCGLNMEKIKTDASSNSKSPLYKLKGKIPFINKPSKNKNTIFVFDVDNKNKTSIDTATVIEVVDKLKDKAIITKKEK